MDGCLKEFGLRMRRIPKTLGFSLLIMLFLIVACGGGDSDDNEPNTQQPDTIGGTPASTVDPELAGQPVDDTLFSDFDEADVPLPEEVVMKNGLTLVSSNHFVQDDRVYVLFVVRNDSEVTIGNIRVNVIMVDEDRLPLENFGFSSPYSNIPSGQTIVVGRDYFMDERWAEYYDDVAAAIVAEQEPADEYEAYFYTDDQAELNLDESKVRGTASNVSSDPLPLLASTFALYDENNEIIGVVSAVPTSGIDSEGYWQPGVTVNFEADVVAVADGDLAAVADVQLIIAGYALNFD